MATRSSSRVRKRPYRFDSLDGTESHKDDDESLTQHQSTDHEGKKVKSRVKKKVNHHSRSGRASVGNEPKSCEYLPYLGDDEPEYEQEEDYSAGVCPGPDADGYYLAENIIKRRQKADGSFEFRVRWKGWGPQHDSWVPYSHCNPFLQEIIRRRYTLKMGNQPLEVSGVKRTLVNESILLTKLETDRRNEMRRMQGIPLDLYSDEEDDSDKIDDSSSNKRRTGFIDQDYIPSEDESYEPLDNDDFEEMFEDGTVKKRTTLSASVTPGKGQTVHHNLSLFSSSASCRRKGGQYRNATNHGSGINYHISNNRGKTLNQDGTLMQVQQHTKLPSSVHDDVAHSKCRKSDKNRDATLEWKNAVSNQCRNNVESKSRAESKDTLIEAIVSQAMDLEQLLRKVASLDLIPEKYERPKMAQLLAHLVQAKALILDDALGFDTKHRSKDICSCDHENLFTCHVCYSNRCQPAYENSTPRNCQTDHERLESPTIMHDYSMHQVCESMTTTETSSDHHDDNNSSQHTDSSKVLHKISQDTDHLNSDDLSLSDSTFKEILPQSEDAELKDVVNPIHDLHVKIESIHFAAQAEEVRDTAEDEIDDDDDEDGYVTQDE